jgi:hypothetical protein
MIVLIVSKLSCFIKKAIHKLSFDFTFQLNHMTFDVASNVLASWICPGSRLFSEVLAAASTSLGFNGSKAQRVAAMTVTCRGRRVLEWRSIVLFFLSQQNPALILVSQL